MESGNVDVEVEVKGSSDDDVFNNDELNSILVKTTTGKTISLEVKGSDTISNLKAKIQAKEHIPFDQQELVYHEMVLEDIYTLAYLRINKDSTLTLMRKLSVFININIKNLQGKLIFHSLKVKPSDTIRSVKTKLCCFEDVLAFNENVLDDSGTLADFHIFNGCTLTLIPKYSKSMKIYVKTLTRKTISLSVYPTYTITKVKSVIELRERIPCDEQVLIFNKMVLDDTCTLFDLHINRKSTLTLMRKSRGFMNIFIKTLTGETITLEVKPLHTINNVKARIQDKTHVPVDKQVLNFNEMVLDNMSTLADYNINKGSILTLMSRGCMHIFIKILSGETVALDAKPSDTIRHVKSKIHDMECIPPCQQRLVCMGNELEDSATLADYHITEESFVFLVLRYKDRMMKVFD
ncbi:putative Ubiquitin-like domain-containing protein [Helianthus annuus]|nr:putative Ubiquitin-like domain-containing protein [Helianthus annuus]KAJ0958235.1 putative Ubiquitin domain-containing protein [Helianthus annuus]